MPYQPEFSSPDRQQYPVHRVLANRYWRLFHKLDPVVGNTIDLYSEMPWSDFQLVGDGVEGEVKDHFEMMLEETKFLSILPFIIREFLVVGEAIIHCMYDADKRAWNYITLHNPDSIEVVDAPFIKMDPIIELIPDQRLRAILSSGDPQLQKVRAQMPPELLGRLLARQNIPLDAMNCTFLPRKLHMYDVRGTSILSRLWRVLMLEDAIFSATLATARRHAGPLRIAKLGNPQTGWIPGPEHEQRLIELLTQAEVDPLAWIVYHFGVQFEAFGTTDRVISVGREWETLERIKLVAMGVSKAFVHGEVTYASSVTGLQVFLQRLLTQRNYLETQWIYPKFFRPISETNKFIKPSQAELSHRIRVRRTAQELSEDNRYIVPKIDWDKKLDPQIDRDMIAALESMERIGVKISRTTKLASINKKFEDEIKQAIAEDVFEAKERQKVQSILGPAGQGASGTQPSGQTVQQFQGPAPGQPGGPPAHAGNPPPRPGTEPQQEKKKWVPPWFRKKNPQQATPEVGPDGVSRTPMPPPEPVSDGSSLKGKIWGPDDTYKNWSKQEAESAVRIFHGEEAEDPFWSQAVTDRFKDAAERGDNEEAWSDLELTLEQAGYPDEDISDMRDILVAEWILKPEAEDFAKGLFEALPDDVGGDSANEEAFLAAFQGKKVGSALDAFSSSTLIGEGNAAALLGGSGVKNPFRTEDK